MIVAAPAPLPEHIGPYRVITRLAAGGMAEVFLVVRRGPAGFERAMVVKRMLPHLSGDPELCAAIVDEARIVGRLRHPNVVSVDDLGIDEGSYFLVLEYLRGESLSALARRLRARGERLEPALAAHVISEACAGLHAAHELADDDGTPLGVVHRDVSPQNVFVTFDGEVKVIDFGIARFSRRASARTKTGIAKGKFAYMAPEQFTGDPLDRRADVFALGALLHELLTGERLFARDSDMQVLKAILQDPIVPPSERWPAIPASLDGVCLRALARDRVERFPTADALRAALRELLPVIDPGQHARDRLTALMRRVLADRWSETEDLLRRTRERSTTRPSPVRPSEPSPEIVAPAARAPASVPPPPRVAPPASNPSIQVLTTDDPTPSLPPSAPTAGPRSPWQRVRLRVVVAAAAAAALALVAWRGHDALGAPRDAPGGPRDAPGAPRDPPWAATPHAAAPPPASTPTPAEGQRPPGRTALPSVAPPPVAAPPARVHLRVETTPDGARVMSGGEMLGTTPCELELARSTDALVLSIERPGYVAARESVVPSADAHLRIHLTRARGEPRTARPRPVFYPFD